MEYTIYQNPAFQEALVLMFNPRIYHYPDELGTVIRVRAMHQLSEAPDVIDLLN